MQYHNDNQFGPKTRAKESDGGIACDKELN